MDRSMEGPSCFPRFVLNITFWCKHHLFSGCQDSSEGCFGEGIWEEISPRTTHTHCPDILNEAARVGVFRRMDSFS